MSELNFKYGQYKIVPCLNREDDRKTLGMEIYLMPWAVHSSSFTQSLSLFPSCSPTFHLILFFIHHEDRKRP